jgi:hypothetical protein
MPDESSCDDGLFCNGAEICRDRVCLEQAPPCGPEVVVNCIRTGCHEDLDACGTFPVPDELLAVCHLTSAVCGAGTGTCIAGVCQVGPTDLCDETEGNSCTDDYCTPDGDGTNPICTHTPVENRTTCAPDELCLGGSGRICIDGMCSIGSSPPCADGSLCTVTTCDSSGGTAECSVDPSPATFPALACGGSATGTTVLSRNDVAGYGTVCPGHFDGGENVWSLAIPSAGRVEIRVNDDDAVGNLSLLLLPDACNPVSCLRVSDAAGLLTLDATTAATVYVVVDGIGAARGPYTLEVTCP